MNYYCDNTLQTSYPQLKYFCNSQVTGVESTWNNQTSTIHQTPRTGRQPKEQGAAIWAPRRATAHSSPWSIPSPSHSLVSVPPKSSPKAGPPESLWMLTERFSKIFQLKGNARPETGAGGRRVPNLWTFWVRLTSAPKPGLYQCEQKLTSLLCKGPENPMLNISVKGVYKLLNSSVSAWNQWNATHKGIGMAVFQ